MMESVFVNSAYRWGADRLKRTGIQSFLLDAHILLAGALNKERFELFKLNYDLISQETWKLYQLLIKKRQSGEPVAYLLRKKEFMSLEFEMAGGVFIPRAETEVLVEEAIKVLSPLCGRLRVLEIGTGSGVIAVSLAKYLSSLNITAIDISEEALKLAERNAEKHCLSDKVVFKKCDINQYEEEKESFDAIISNPPYVCDDDWRSLPDSIKKYEPSSALLAGEDGLEFYKIIAGKAGNILKKEGYLFLEIGWRQADEVKNILLKNKFKKIEVLKDLSNLNRVVTANK